MDGIIETLGWWRIMGLPLVGGLIGWLTNALAVRMIFRPRKPFGVGPLRYQGLVPKRQNELAASIGRTVEEHLISHEDIQQLLNKPQIQEELDALVTTHIKTFIDVKLKDLSPMVGMLVTGQMRERVEKMLKDEVRAFVPEVTDRMLTRFEEEVKFREMVETKVANFDLERLERIILDIASRELRAIELLGGLIGLVIGLLQLALLAL